MSDAEFVAAARDQTEKLYRAFLDYRDADEAATDRDLNKIVRLLNEAQSIGAELSRQFIGKRLDELAQEHLETQPKEWGLTFLSEVEEIGHAATDSHLCGQLVRRYDSLRQLALLVKPETTGESEQTPMTATGKEKGKSGLRPLETGRSEVTDAMSGTQSHPISQSGEIVKGPYYVEAYQIVGSVTEPDFRPELNLLLMEVRLCVQAVKACESSLTEQASEYQRVLARSAVRGALHRLRERLVRWIALDGAAATHDHQWPQLPLEANLAFDILRSAVFEARPSVSGTDFGKLPTQNLEQSIGLLEAAMSALPSHTVSGQTRKADDRDNWPLGEECYGKILRIIIDVGKAMERHRNTYCGKDEEALRDHFLTVLNSHFPNTTGETFNKKGKTDILIRHENHNVFVAECKYWSGPKAFHCAIDQLLGYLTWRDSKSALMLFVKNKEFSSVIRSIEQETPKHACFDKLQGNEEMGRLAFDFHLPGDAGQHIRLTVLVFHFPEQPLK